MVSTGSQSGDSGSSVFGNISWGACSCVPSDLCILKTSSLFLKLKTARIWLEMVRQSPPEVLEWQGHFLQIFIPLASIQGHDKYCNTSTVVKTRPQQGKFCLINNWKGFIFLMSASIFDALFHWSSWNRAGSPDVFIDSPHKCYASYRQVLYIDNIAQYFMSESCGGTFNSISDITRKSLCAAVYNCSRRSYPSSEKKPIRIRHFYLSSCTNVFETDYVTLKRAFHNNYVISRSSG